MKYNDHELLYSATARCRCGAGVAYPLDHQRALQMGAWVCSAVLKEDVDVGQHDSFPWAFFKIREETSINNRTGCSTRPPGTVARTIGRASCPKCHHVWESPPYSACNLNQHWQCGACPRCGHSTGSEHGWHPDKSEAIDTRYRDVVIDVPGADE